MAAPLELKNSSPNFLRTFNHNYFQTFNKMVPNKDKYEAYYAAHPGICKTVIQKVYSWKVSQNPDNNFFPCVDSSYNNSVVTAGCSPNPPKPSTPPNGVTPTVGSQSSPVVRASTTMSASTGSGRPVVKTRIPQRVGLCHSPVALTPLREPPRVTLRQPNF